MLSVDTVRGLSLMKPVEPREVSGVKAPSVSLTLEASRVPRSASSACPQNLAWGLGGATHGGRDTGDQAVGEEAGSAPAVLMLSATTSCLFPLSLPRRNDLNC